ARLRTWSGGAAARWATFTLCLSSDGSWLGLCHRHSPARITQHRLRDIRSLPVGCSSLCPDEISVTRPTGSSSFCPDGLYAPHPTGSSGFRPDGLSVACPSGIRHPPTHASTHAPHPRLRTAHHDTAGAHTNSGSYAARTVAVAAPPRRRGDPNMSAAW